MKHTSYTSTALAMYINYMFQGVAAIILAQNMSSLMVQLDTDASGVAFVISAIGLGRVCSVLISGALSDKYGRKPLILAGMGAYIIFFVGILFSTDIWTAAFFTLFAGIANAFLDTGTYPALAEIFPRAKGTVSVLLRTFIALGQFILPLLVGFLTLNELYFGYSFLIFAFLIVLNGFFMIKRPFIQHKKEDNVQEEREISKLHFASPPKFRVEGICLVLIGFTSPATFNIIATWLPTYAREMAGMAEVDALKLISIYSFSAFVSLLLTSYMVKKLVNPVTLIFIYPCVSLLALIALQLHPTPFMSIVTAILIGFFAAGGIFQLALATLLELFPKNKGRKTAMTSMAAAISFMVIPAITGVIASVNIYHVMTFNILVTIIGAILAAIVKIRYHKLIPHTSVEKIA